MLLVLVWLLAMHRTLQQELGVVAEACPNWTAVVLCDFQLAIQHSSEAQLLVNTSL